MYYDNNVRGRVVYHCRVLAGIWRWACLSWRVILVLYVMDLTQHSSLRMFRGKTQTIRQLQRVIAAVLPTHLADGVQVCGVRANRLICQIPTPVIRLTLQAQHAVLLAAVRQVSAEVTDITWIVRPWSSSQSPLQHHRAQQAVAKGQMLSLGAQKYLGSLASRCRHSRIKSTLERILKRYATRRLESEGAVIETE